MRNNGILKDTFITMRNGERQHAMYAKGDNAHGKTAIIVHGYKDCGIKFLYLGKMYHHNMGYNILIPDLHAHGLSDGEDIQMGWKDRYDILYWTKTAESMFRDKKNDSRIVMHGVSMGAATIMNVSGEQTPQYIKCFIEDCGYTGVWDEFKGQLKDQFSLPAFPIMYTTNILCQLKHGWNFKEASPLTQVAKCHKPMLFIHGDADTFVPTGMAGILYNAKPGVKELWITNGTKHAESFKDHPEEYLSKVSSFIIPYMNN